MKLRQNVVWWYCRYFKTVQKNPQGIEKKNTIIFETSRTQDVMQDGIVSKIHVTKSPPVNIILWMLSNDANQCKLAQLPSTPRLKTSSSAGQSKNLPHMVRYGLDWLNLKMKINNRSDHHRFYRLRLLYGLMDLKYRMSTGC